ncbi:MAG: class II glutamine amidotransferase [Polyangiaceae bacterium]|nr:class II glutamine amidotransferase [Polyangiaceae bacterium]
MARVFGFIGNQPALTGPLLKTHAGPLRVRATRGSPLGWGLGFYHAGEALLRRRPVDDREIIDLASVSEQIRTEILLAHIRTPTIGRLRTENTHPFRYREWMFAQTGTIAGFSERRARIMASHPEFLRRNIRGDTDSEVFFFLFLSLLHEAGHLSDNSASPGDARTALRKTFQLIDELGIDGPPQSAGGDLMLSNGDFLIAAHGDGLMGMHEVTGEHAVSELFAHDADAPRVSDPASARFTLIAGALDELPNGWTRVDPGCIVTLTRNGAPGVEAFSSS